MTKRSALFVLCVDRDLSGDISIGFSPSRGVWCQKSMGQGMSRSGTFKDTHPNYL